MINEVLEVKKYLNGDCITPKGIYRACYLLAKWYKQQDKSPLEIRKLIFEWGKKFNIFIKYDVNTIIYHAINDKRKLNEDIVVKISKNDFKRITECVDRKNTQITALALLCYAKVFADSDSEITISSVDLGNWLNIDDSRLRRNHIKELIDFGYISKITRTQKYVWEKKSNSSKNTYKVNAPIRNTGDFELHGNDIMELYKKLLMI